MNWESSRALTPLKRDFLRRFYERSESFFVTGGSALGIFYLQHRLSLDLDFFSTDDHIDWHVLANTIRTVAEAVGAQYRSITASPLFHRIELTRAHETEILDFVLERVPQLDKDKARFGNVRVDTLREIMANKICMLVSRCETKDLVDLYFLARRGFRVRDYLEDARKKEAGLDPAMIAYLLAQVRIETSPDCLLEPVAPADLQAFVDALRQEVASIAYPESEP